MHRSVLSHYLEGTFETLQFTAEFKRASQFFGNTVEFDIFSKSEGLGGFDHDIPERTPSHLATCKIPLPSEAMMTPMAISKEGMDWIGFLVS